MDNIFEEKEDRFYALKIIFAAIMIAAALSVTAYIAYKAWHGHGIKTTIMYVTEKGEVMVERHIQR